MSLTFKVQNKSKIFGGSAAAMSVDEVLQLVPNLEQFELFDGEDGYDELMDSLLGERVLLVGTFGLSGRGFELNYEDNAYLVRINTPSTPSDWRIALEFLSALARKTGNKIKCENGEIYDEKSILGFDFKSDIWAGVNAIKDCLADGSERLQIYGITRVAYIDQKLFDELFADGDLAKFDEFMRRIQSYDAYDAKQNLYEKDGEIKGVYVLSQNLPTILPFHPSPHWQYADVLAERKVSEWVLTLVGGESENAQEFDVLCEVGYEKFLQNLPKELYKFIDANNILIELSFEQIKELTNL